jgi:pimeloyl-ACP methyl ester carboxylesterase
MVAPGILTRPDGATIAYRRLSGAAPGIVFLSGFRSDMTGKKALFIDEYCRARRAALVRFDYFGHGASSGDLLRGTIGRWAADGLAVIDSLTEGPQILVGSSMGGWIMLLAALARPDRIRALLGIAAAPDFTEDLLLPRLGPAGGKALREAGALILPSEWDPAGYTYTRALIEEGRRHLLLRGPIAISVPVRLLHGMADDAVPWQRSLLLCERLQSPDVTLTLVKGAGHRLSAPSDLARLAATLDELRALAAPA